MCWNKLKPMSEIKVGDQFKNKSVSFWKCLTVLKKTPFVTSLSDFYWNRRADSLSVFWPKNSVSVVLNTTSWDSSLCCLCETFISLWRPLVSRISYLEHSSLHLGLWCYWCTVWWLHNRHFKSGAFFFCVFLWEIFLLNAFHDIICCRQPLLNNLFIPCAIIILSNLDPNLKLSFCTPESLIDGCCLLFFHRAFNFVCLECSYLIQYKL